MRMRTIGWILTAACLVWLLCLGLAGCESGGTSHAAPENGNMAEAEDSAGEVQRPQVHVCIDLGVLLDQKELSKILDRIPGAGESFDLLTECLPHRGPQREKRLEEIRAQLAAGAGPDLLLCAQDRLSQTNILDGETFYPLFPFPERAMAKGVFLPLDSYIKNAQYMDWDKQLSAVMEAGKSRDGQCLVPILYTFDAMAFPKEDYTLTEKLPITWEEMLESQDPLVLKTAYFSYAYAPFRQVVDGETGQLAITQEELAQRFRQKKELEARMPRGEFSFIPVVQQQEGEETPAVPHIVSCDSLFVIDVREEMFLADTVDYIMVPCYNDAGGVTARVCAFGGVNRHARQPEYAFRVLDFLMQDQIQQEGFFLSGRFNGFVTSKELGQQEGGLLVNGRGLNSWNFSQFRQMQEQIDTARFLCDMDQEIQEACIYHMYENGQEEETAQEICAAAAKKLSES